MRKNITHSILIQTHLQSTFLQQVYAKSKKSIPFANTHLLGKHLWFASVNHLRKHTRTHFSLMISAIKLMQLPAVNKVLK